MFLKMASSKYFEQMQPPFNNGKIWLCRMHTFRLQQVIHRFMLTITESSCTWKLLHNSGILVASVKRFYDE
jgi:hypothetical protein